MPEARVIEVWGESVALALQVNSGFKFVAAAPRVAALDGKLYPTFGHARLAAIQQARFADETTYSPANPSSGAHRINLGHAHAPRKPSVNHPFRG